MESSDRRHCVRVHRERSGAEQQATSGQHFRKHHHGHRLFGEWQRRWCRDVGIVGRDDRRGFVPHRQRFGGRSSLHTDERDDGEYRRVKYTLFVGHHCGLDYHGNYGRGLLWQIRVGFGHRDNRQHD